MCDQIILNIELTIKIRTLFKRKRNTDLYGFQRNLKLKAWMLSKKVSTCGRGTSNGVLVEIMRGKSAISENKTVAWS